MIKTIDSTVSCPDCGYVHCVSLLRVHDNGNNFQIGIVCPRCPKVLNRTDPTGLRTLQGEINALAFHDQFEEDLEVEVLPHQELAKEMADLLVRATASRIDYEDLLVLAVAVMNGTVQIGEVDG